jgi:hypothetical protein
MFKFIQIHWKYIEKYIGIFEIHCNITYTIEMHLYTLIPEGQRMFFCQNCLKTTPLESHVVGAK